MVNKSFWEFFSNTPGLICHNCDLGCLSFIDFCDNAQLSSMVLTNCWTPAVCIHPPALLRLSPLFIFYSISSDLANSLDKGSWSRMSWGIFCAKQKDFTCVEEQWADQMCSELWRKIATTKIPWRSHYDISRPRTVHTVKTEWLTMRLSTLPMGPCTNSVYNVQYMYINVCWIKCTKDIYLQFWYLIYMD